jgi:hypothetical protein
MPLEESVRVKLATLTTRSKQIPKSEAWWNYLDTVLPTIAPCNSLARHLARMLFMIPEVGEPISPARRKQLHYDFNTCNRLIEGKLDLIEAATVWLIIRSWSRYMAWADDRWNRDPGPFIDVELELRQRYERDLGIQIQ